MTHWKVLEFSFITVLGKLDKGNYVNPPIYWINTCMQTISWKTSVMAIFFGMQRWTNKSYCCRSFAKSGFLAFTKKNETHKLKFV